MQSAARPAPPLLAESIKEWLLKAGLPWGSRRFKKDFFRNPKFSLDALIASRYCTSYCHRSSVSLLKTKPPLRQLCFGLSFEKPEMARAFLTCMLRGGAGCWVGMCVDWTGEWHPYNTKATRPCTVLASATEERRTHTDTVYMYIHIYIYMYTCKEGRRSICAFVALAVVVVAAAAVVVSVVATAQAKPSSI